MPGFTGIQSLRGVGAFASTYLWDARFDAEKKEDKPPYPFQEWFPAKMLDEPIFALVSKQAEYYMSMYMIPQGHTRLTMNMSFYDREDGILERWFREWGKKIIGDGLELLPLEDCCRILEVSRLSRKKEVLQTIRYFVYPENNLRVAHNSESSARILDLGFHIAGMRITKDLINTTVE